MDSSCYLNESPNSLRTLRSGASDRLPLDWSVPSTDAQLRTTSREHVEGGNVRCNVNCFAHARVDDITSQTQALGDRRGGREGDEG